MLCTEFPPKIGGLATSNDTISKILETMGHKIDIIYADEELPQLVCFEKLTQNIKIIRMRKVAFRTIFISLFLLLKGPYDVIQADYPLTGIPVVFKKRIEKNTRFLQLLQGDMWQEFESTKLFQRHLLLKASTISLQHADLILTDGIDLKNKLLHHGFHAERIRTIVNANNTELFKPSNSTIAPKNEKYTIMFHGRLSFENGPDILLRAFAEIKKTASSKLVFVGTGSMESDLKDLCLTLGLETSVEFRGRVPHEKLPSILSEASLCVYPIRRCGGVSQVILEAMACEKTVISTEVGSNQDVIRTGENGFLVPPENVKALAEAISKNLGNYELHKKIGKAARRTVLEKFSYEQTNVKYKKLYAELLTEKTRRG